MAKSLRIGVLVTLYGPLARLGEDGLRGVELASSEFGGEIVSCLIKLYPEGTISSPDVAEYYLNAKAGLVALQSIGGDLSQRQRQLYKIA